jgi:hypothetical protein
MAARGIADGYPQFTAGFGVRGDSTLDHCAVDGLEWAVLERAEDGIH